MGNPFIPFPRNENIIIVGDTATEILGALRIFGKGLIGGEVPSMELRHPNEKHLECISCFLNHPEQILAPAVRKIGADFVLLEANGKAGFDPSTAEGRLVEMGIPVKVLDVNGTPEEVLRRAGELFGEQRQAERVIRERSERLEALSKLEVPKGQTAVILLAIRSPIRHESYVFRVAAHSELSQLLAEQWDVINLFESSRELDQIEGIQPLGDISELLMKNPDVIAIAGDTAAGGAVIRKAVKAHPELQSYRALREGRIVGVPYYCRPLEWQAPMILERWADALIL